MFKSINPKINLNFIKYSIRKFCGGVILSFIYLFKEIEIEKFIKNLNSYTKADI
jgi:hypothetical protein